MSEGDPAEFPKPSDREQLQVAKEGNLDGSTLPRLWRRLQTYGQIQGHGQTGELLVLATPPTPPPFPRPNATAQMIRQSLQQAEQLKEDHRQTDELIDQVLAQATEINRQLILRNQMVRKRRLLRELETRYTGSMHVLVETIRAEFDSI